MTKSRCYLNEKLKIRTLMDHLRINLSANFNITNLHHSPLKITVQILITHAVIVQSIYISGGFGLERFIQKISSFIIRAKLNGFAIIFGRENMTNRRKIIID